MLIPGIETRFDCWAICGEESGVKPSPLKPRLLWNMLGLTTGPVALASRGANAFWFGIGAARNTPITLFDDVATIVRSIEAAESGG